MKTNNLFILLSIIILTGLSGCAQLLSNNGNVVKIESNARMIRACKSLGTVKGSSSLGLNKAQKIQSSLVDMKNNAAILGANTVVIISTETMFEGTTVMGKAYSCPARLIIK